MVTVTVNGMTITVKGEVVCYQNRRGEVVDLVISKTLADTFREQSTKVNDLTMSSKK